MRLRRPATEANAFRIDTDPDAFEAFYRQNVAAVQLFVARRVSSRERAADLTADIFVAAIESAGRYRPDQGTPDAWIYGIARRVVAGDRRRNGRERRAATRLLGRRLVDEQDAARIDERLDAEAQHRRLYGEIARLPSGQRAVLELYAVDGLSLVEVASALAISPASARVRLHRARAQMKDRMANRESQPSPRPQEAAP